MAAATECAEAPLDTAARRKLLQDLFGDEDESEDAPAPAWQPVDGVAGLFVWRAVLDDATQAALRAWLCKEGWFVVDEAGSAPDAAGPGVWTDVRPGSYNQGMFFGQLPAVLADAAAPLEAGIRALWAGFCGNASSDAARRPLFNQAIVNVYGPDGFIRPHVDLARFADGILVLSLGSAATMTFAPVAAGAATVAAAETEVAVALLPGDALWMCGPARYVWTHRIDRADSDVWPDGVRRVRRTRVSLTLRRLAETCADADSADGPAGGSVAG